MNTAANVMNMNNMNLTVWLVCTPAQRPFSDIIDVIMDLVLGTFTDKEVKNKLLIN